MSIKYPHKSFSQLSRKKISFANKLRKTQTRAEKILGCILNRKQVRARGQFYPQVIILGWIVDFYCSQLMLVIEVDGSSHNCRRIYDDNREKVMKDKAGIKTLRFTNKQVIEEKEMVFGWIMKAIEDADIFSRRDREKRISEYLRSKNPSLGTSGGNLPLSNRVGPHGASLVHEEDREAYRPDTGVTPSLKTSVT